MALGHRPEIAAHPVRRGQERSDSALHSAPDLVKRPVPACLEDGIVELEIRFVEIPRGATASRRLHAEDQRLQPFDRLRCQARHQEPDREFLQGGAKRGGFSQRAFVEIRDARSAIRKLDRKSVAFEQEQRIPDRTPTGAHLLGNPRLHEVRPRTEATLENGLSQAVGDLFGQRRRGVGVGS
jgi:hypothetical protein